MPEEKTGEQGTSATPPLPRGAAPFAVVVEWIPGATQEQQDEANKTIAELMSHINDPATDPKEILSEGLSRLTIKRA